MALVDMSETFKMTNVGEHIDGTDVYQSNRNLLDNPWFTVNQRGQASYSAGTSYNVDRWVLFGSSPNSVTVNSDYISVASGNNGFAQYIPTELASFLNGKTITLSVMDYNGNVASGTLTYSNTALQSTDQLTVDGVSVCRLYCGLLSGKQLGASLIVGTGNTVRIKAIKLELGSVSTLANDVPPDYGTELLKCQRYCRVLSATTGGYVALGYAMSATSFRLQFPFAMRTAPTVSFSGTINLNGVNAVTAISSTGSFSDFVSLNITSSGLTTGSTYLLNITSGAKIILSADL